MRREISSNAESRRKDFKKRTTMQSRWSHYNNVLISFLAENLIYLAVLGLLSSGCTVQNQPKIQGTVDTREQPPSKPDVKLDVPLGVLFNGWFGFDHNTGECKGGIGSTHWNDGPDTGGVVHKPISVESEIDAFYCSADPVRVAYQIKKLEDTGVSILLYSWWGWGDRDLDGKVEGHPDQWINHSIIEILHQLKEKNSPIKVVILIEPFTYTQAKIEPDRLTYKQMQRILDYLYYRYYRAFPDQMFEYQGRPLLSTFDPMFMVGIGMVEPTVTGTPEDNNQIEWAPKADKVSLEIAKGRLGSKLQVDVSADNRVRIVLPTNMAGKIISTVDEVIAAVGQNPDAEALCHPRIKKGSNGSNLVKPTEEIALTQTTKLVDQALSGSDFITVKNENGFKPGDYIQLGDIDEEQPEILQISDIIKSDGQVRRLRFKTSTESAHSKHALVKKVDFHWTHKRLSSKNRDENTEREGWHWWLVPQQPLSHTLSNDGVVFLNHRFSEYYLYLAGASYLDWEWRNIDPEFHLDVYRKHWQWALDNRKRLNIIFVYSWNFYGELAQLEPSEFGPAPPGEEYVYRTKKYYQQFLTGATRLQ